MSDPIVVERVVSAPPSVVYAYLTDSDRWSRWQGEHADIDATEGGAVVLGMPNGAVARGNFVELVPDRRVRFTWGWEGHPTIPPGSTIVAIDLIAEGSTTRIRLTHTGLPPDEIDLHISGWNHYLSRLASVAAGLSPGPDTGPG